MTIRNGTPLGCGGFLGSVTLLALLAGCASPEPIFPPLDPPLVWPRSGGTPRFSYVGSLSGEADLKRPRSLWNWFGDVWGGAEPAATIRNASDVAVTAGGILYVADPGAQVVHRLDLESREYRAITDAGGGRRFETPIGVAVAGEALIVSDRSLGTVTVFSPSGEPRTVVGSSGLQGPVGISVGPRTGRIYVADVASHHIVAFGPDGALLFVTGGRGTEPGKFNYPTHIACDASEHLYVTDTLNCRIQVFDRRGYFLRAWGRRGNGAGEFSRPKGVACDRWGRVYVVDSHFENVQVFTPQGELLLAFGEEGTGPGQFWIPAGIFVDERDTIWIGDSYNHRVQVFRYLGGGEAQEAP